jgi:hypothetical protein
LRIIAVDLTVPPLISRAARIAVNIEERYVGLAVMVVIE